MDYRRLPARPYRFYLVTNPGRSSSWLKVDLDTGNVVEASNAFAWAIEKPIETVERWCKSKNKILRKLHGNIQSIEDRL